MAQVVLVTRQFLHHCIGLDICYLGCGELETEMAQVVLVARQFLHHCIG